MKRPVRPLDDLSIGRDDPERRAKKTDLIQRHPGTKTFRRSLGGHFEQHGSARSGRDRDRPATERRLVQPGQRDGQRRDLKTNDLPVHFEQKLDG